MKIEPRIVLLLFVFEVNNAKSLKTKQVVVKNVFL